MFDAEVAAPEILGDNMPVAGAASGEREVRAQSQFSGLQQVCQLLRRMFHTFYTMDIVSGMQACKTEACAIQTCLSKSHYQSEECQKQIQDLMKCCEKYQVRVLSMCAACSAHASISCFEVACVHGVTEIS